MLFLCVTSKSYILTSQAEGTHEKKVTSGKLYSVQKNKDRKSTTEYVCVCVCVFVAMSTHCTITRFGFRARRIDGVECGLFSNHAPLGRTTLRVG